MIIVNGLERDFSEDHIGYDQVVSFVHSTPTTALFTITFYRGPQERPEGSLRRGEMVRVVDGVVFCACVTSRA